MSRYGAVRRRRLFGPTLDIVEDGAVSSQPLVGQAGLDLGGGEYLYVSNTGLVYKWDGSSWSNVRATRIDSNSNDVRLLWQDANGNLYYSTTNSGVLHRSTDGGATWSVVITFPNGVAGPDYAAPMDGNGSTIWCTAYSGLDPGPTEGLYRSTDSGATWADITANKPSSLDRHGHGVYYDPYRGVLYWTHGDSGLSSDIFYSTDDGDTFSTWASSNQATAMGFTEEFGFFTADRSSDRSIYRFKSPGDVPELAFDASTLPGFVSHVATAGVCWDTIKTSDESLVFVYMNATTDAPVWFIGTNDNGYTWHNIGSDAFIGGSIDRRFANNCYPLCLGRSKYRSYDDGVVRKISIY